MCGSIIPMNSPVQEIKERLSIVDVISPYVKLEKSGLHMRGRCPFHNEKTPSFFVSPERGTFHCFGCGKGGDVFTFIQDIEGLTFPESLKQLADRAGVVIPKEGNVHREKEPDNTQVYRALELATKYYELVLQKFPDALEYVRGRGVSDASIASFRIGFAPDGWRNLSTFLSSKGISEDVQEKAGLAIKSQKGFYDRFRSRIMFPIMNPQGKVVGFSGRIFGDTSADPTVAKYVNSPETIVYNKSRILFGYDKAKQAIARERRAVLVEGQMDLVLAHQAGTNEAVAVSGTALTSYHLSMLKRFTDSLVLCFDGDQAGMKASERAVGLAYEAGMDVSVIRMPKGVDPADMIKEDESTWRDALKHPKHFIEMYTEVLREATTDDRMFKKEVTTRVLPYVARLKSAIDRAHFISLLARRLGVGEEVVAEDLRRIPKPDVTYTIREAFAPTEVNRKEGIIKALTGIALWKKTTDSELAAKIEKALNDMLQREESPPTDSPESNTLIFETELVYKDRDIAKETDALLRNLERELLKDKLAALMNEFHAAESAKDKAKSDELLHTIRTTKNQLESLSIES